MFHLLHTWKENISPKWQMLVCVYKHFFQKGGGKKMELSRKNLTSTTVGVSPSKCIFATDKGCF